ncbi:MAG TPA: acetyl-CoA acetyltransferase [Acidimicrobiia bacterium]|nr:acetyl-CoA acetyltransferase [Acidimicrobiia bacterium]
MIDGRTPVIVGVGQASQRPDQPDAALEPIDLLAQAARAAHADAGGTRDLAVDTVAVAAMLSWKYPDPGALVARRLGIAPRRTLLSTVGGNSPQLLLNELADAISRGETDVALIGGAECMFTRLRARKEPRADLGWTVAHDPPCPNLLGDDRPGSSPYEMAHLAVAPTQVYPLFETALRAAAGRSVAEHQAATAELWSSFAAVAATNPHAWSRTAYSADEIATPGPDNRMVTFPYTKRMCANIQVDQAAAFLVCSYAAARAAGVADDRMVFPRAGAEAHDRYFFTNRDTLHASPAIAAATTAGLDAIGAGVDDIARFDLYSCFPSAVQIAMGALGLEGPGAGDSRPLTVTGGLAFAGGPGNSYVSHSIAAMVQACRGDPGSLGLVTALGWYVTKHAVGVYSTEPGTGFCRTDRDATQARLDGLAGRDVAGLHTGAATVEATSVGFERDGTPAHAILSLLTDDGRRALANCRDADVLRDMTETPWEGRRVELRADDDSNILVT